MHKCILHVNSKFFQKVLTYPGNEDRIIVRVQPGQTHCMQVLLSSFYNPGMQITSLTITSVASDFKNLKLKNSEK